MCVCVCVLKDLMKKRNFPNGTISLRDQQHGSFHVLPVKRFQKAQFLLMISNML